MTRLVTRQDYEALCPGAFLTVIQDPYLGWPGVLLVLPGRKAKLEADVRARTPIHIDLRIYNSHRELLDDLGRRIADARQRLIRA